MFQVGDKIFYPMHGVGVIEAIEEKEVLGTNKLYYILNISKITMQIMIPMENALNLGIRQVVEPETLENVLKDIWSGNTDPIIYENQRSCMDMNKKKIKSGDIYEGTEVIRDLTRKGRRNKLGAEDSRILTCAREIFVSELMQVKGINHGQANELLDEALEPLRSDPKTPLI